jgi:uncharacterized protein (TIGR03118 family)
MERQTLFRSRPRVLVGLLAVALTPALAPRAAAQAFQPINLVTDDPAFHPGLLTDPSLVNAWGVSFGPTSPFWVSDNATGLATLYSVNPVTNAPTKVGLTVTIPGDGSVTGQVFNAGSAAGAFNNDAFLFVSEDGTISGWRGALGTAAEILQSPDPANVYKGVAVATTGGHSYLLSANFASGSIDVLKGDSNAPNLAGKFTDPNLPAGFAPFNIQNLNGTIYVTYAKKGAGKDEAVGPGQGILDQFDLQGNFQGRFSSQGSLNAPWGLALAPASFGPFAGDLLVGNFGDGTISAFNLGSNTFAGQLPGQNAKPLTIDGLWALSVGNGGSAGSASSLYFTAGPNNESHGVLGVLAVRATAAPEPGPLALLLGSALPSAWLWRRRIIRRH